MAVLERRVFCNCAAGSFRPAPPDADQLRSREPVTFIYSVGPVRFCLPALHPAESITEKLHYRSSAHDRIPGRRPRPLGFYVLAGLRWASAGQ